MSRLKNWWNAQTLKRQTFIFIAVAIIVTVLLVELVVEPIVEGNFTFDLDDLDWHEVPQWVAGAFILGMLSATVITRAIMRGLDRLANATDQIAIGNLSARVEEAGNPDDVFSRLSRSINAMAETIECLLTNERRLLSDISHELRSPLARINAAVELMAMKNEGNGNAAHLRRIEMELSHMNHLVGVLLEQGRNRLAVREGRETVDFTILAGELTDSFRLQGETQRITLRDDIAPGLRVDGHPMQLHLIVENILGNAMFYAPPESEVEVRAIRVGRLVVLCIRDQGRGVPEAQLEDIFKPFYRVDASRARQSGGIGLGLTLVKEACVALGGAVRAENAAPGLLVTVELLASGDAVPANVKNSV